MGQRGPKTQPPQLKVINGNPGRRPIDLDAGINPRVATPKCPAFLLDEAKAEWKRLAPQLEELGLISELDLAAFAMYCQAYGRWAQAEKQMRELNAAAADRRKAGATQVSDSMRHPGYVQRTPSGYEQQSHWLNIANRNMELVLKFAAEFGLSPSMRARVTASRDLGQQQLPGVDPPPNAPQLPEKLSLASFGKH